MEKVANMVPKLIHQQSLVNSNLASLQNRSVDLKIHMEKQETQQCCKNTARGLTLPNLIDLKDVFCHLLHVSLCVGVYFSVPTETTRGLWVLWSWSYDEGAGNQPLVL